jgi:hypothetical protein
MHKVQGDASQHTIPTQGFITLTMEAVHASETSVYSKTIQRYIPEGYNLDILLVLIFLHLDMYIFGFL